MASQGGQPPDVGDFRAVDELRAGGDSPGRSLPPWVWRVISAVSVAALVLVVGHDLLSDSPTGRPAAGPSTQPTSTAGFRPSPPALPLVWAARGDRLDTPFAAAALAKARVERPDVDRLLWAGTVDGSDQVALFSIRPSPNVFAIEGVEVGALRIPSGGVLAESRLQPVGSVRGPDSRVGAAWVGADGRTRLLVLGRPGPMRVDVSAIIKYRPDGGIGRRWRTVRAPDGVTVVDLGHRTDPVLVVRPFRRTPGENFLVTVGGTRAPVGLHIDGVASPTYAGPDPAVLVRGVTDAVSALVDVRRTTARVIWSGEINEGTVGLGHTSVTGRGALVRLRRDDGPVFQAFVFTNSEGTLNSYSAYVVPWAVGDRLPYIFSTYDEGAPLLVLNPSGLGTVTVTSRAGERTTARTDANGVGVVADDASRSLGYGGSAVTVRDPRGRVVLRSMMVDVGSVDPYGLYL